MRPSVKTLGAEVRRREREVLRRPGQVAEPDVNELHPFVLDELQDVVGGVEHANLPWGTG